MSPHLASSWILSEAEKLARWSCKVAIFSFCKNQHIGSRPGNSCKLSSSGKFKNLQCPQNSVIRDKGWPEIYTLNVGVAWWNHNILIANSQSIVFHPQVLPLNPLKSILLPEISFIKTQFSIFQSSTSILRQKCRILDSKCPQNSGISDKMSASAACTACSFFQGSNVTLNS